MGFTTSEDRQPVRQVAHGAMGATRPKVVANGTDLPPQTTVI